jgi:2-desacetyl-2-hydroxyethyl bacteriochlorophyllide A dehydrogenase
VKAVVLVSQGLDVPRRKVLVEDWPDPGPPTVEQFRTRTLYTGITNGTERNDMLRGNYSVDESSLPSLGVAYQNVGVVQAVGDGVSGVKVGDLVFSSCPHVEYVVQPGDGLYLKLPEGFPPAEAALLGMVGVAVRAVETAVTRASARVLVVGAGFVGQLLAQVAACHGAEVSITDLDPDRRRLAASHGGLAAVLSPDQFEALAGGTFSVVLDAAGVPGMESRLIDLAARHGRVLLLAGRAEVRYNFNEAQQREISVQHSSHFDTSDLAAAAGLLATGRLRVRPLMDPERQITDAESVYEALMRDPSSVRATVFRW